MVTAARKRLFLRYLYGQSKTLGKSLFVVLTETANTYVGQVIGSASGGRTPITHSGNGRTVAFAIPDYLKFETSEERGDMYELFFEVYADALDSLGITQTADNDASKDDSIFAAMIDDIRLATVKVTHTDNTLGRLLYGGVLQTP